ncbi:putative protein phosphatase B regulatory subunit [Babesia divergens]|uniref:Serine/threonine protein phosphatase 2A regulatory subunit n=1 Tax=Babesia divergens TaxID=32595 RepID=A0AAD9GF90_BABDI|nr:putative protein phosphatase B regulatory subunit [Babesia divergens]
MLRFFKGYKDRKADESQKASVESDSKRNEYSFHRSIIRSVSSFFWRYPEEEDSVSRSVQQRGNTSSEVEGKSSTSRQRLRWRSHGGSQSEGCAGDRTASEGDNSSDHCYSLPRSRNCVSEEDFVIRRASSSSRLPSAPIGLRGLDDTPIRGSRHFRRGSTDVPFAESRLDSPVSDGIRILQAQENDFRVQHMLEDGLPSSVSRGPGAVPWSRLHMESSRPSKINHTSTLGEDAIPHHVDSPDESADGGKKTERLSRWRSRERRFFSLRRSISSLKRSLSTPKAGDKGGDTGEYHFGRVRPLIARYGSLSDKDEDSSSSVSDNDKSPSRLRRALALDLPSIYAMILPDSIAARDDAGARRKMSEPLASCKERVVVLTAGTTVEASAAAPVKWDPETVRKMEATFSVLPLLKDVPLNSRAEVFQRKLIACQTVVDFGAKKVMQRAIELKRQTLLEIIEYISTTRNCMNERLLQDVIDMVEANVFRSLSPRDKKPVVCYDAEEDEPALEKSWPHLQIVYDVFLRVIVSNEVTSKMVKNVIDKPFVLKLLSVISSEDQRERDYLKTILHRIYGKIMPLRNFIRKAMDNVFTNFIYETGNPHGITELLEILGSIINGFAVPLKDEHKLYLEKSLTPLHKPKSVRVYHAALSYCMIQYINKDRSLAGMILRSILKFWPTSSALTEILFLNELEEVLSLTELTELNEIVRLIAKRLSQCVSSVHFQVAERALYVWNNSRVARQLNINKEIVYPYVVPAIKANLAGHWNETVRVLTSNVAKMMAEHDYDLYNNCESIIGSSRAFHAVTLTPQNSWDAVAPGVCYMQDLVEPVELPPEIIN